MYARRQRPPGLGLQREKPGTAVYEKLQAIKQLMEQRGIRFPAEPPPVVRAEMKKKGMKVAE